MGGLILLICLVPTSRLRSGQMYKYLSRGWLRNLEMCRDIISRLYAKHDALIIETRDHIDKKATYAAGDFERQQKSSNREQARRSHDAEKNRAMVIGDAEIRSEMSFASNTLA